MSILTEKEREDVYKYWLHSSTLTNEDGLIQLAEKAVLEKLAGMELPEPVAPNKDGATQCIVRWMVETPFGWIGAYEKGAFDAYAHQAYAQGAASQLMEKPVGFCHIGQIENIEDGYAYVYPSKGPGASTPLYTLKEAK